MVTARPPPRDHHDSDWRDRELTARVQVKAQVVLVFLDAERGEGGGGVLPEDVQREEEVRSHDPRSDRPPPQERAPRCGEEITDRWARRRIDFVSPHDEEIAATRLDPLSL